MKSILSTCIREAKSGREVLIICKSIKRVQDINKELSKVYEGNIYTLKECWSGTKFRWTKKKEVYSN